MNHQDYVANFCLYQASLYFTTNLLSFWIEQVRREVTGRHLLFMMFIFLGMLYFTTYFVSEAYDMNDDLTKQQE